MSRHQPSTTSRSVRLLEVDERGDGQRLDNYVLRECPRVPKTRLYRAMRKGEIRVNKGRVKPDQRLRIGDVVRIPPLVVADKATLTAPGGWQERLASAVVYEDRRIIALNKPAGIAVHGGSGLRFGMIETLRSMRPEERGLELVHRLDRETSGLLLVAKQASALKELHALLRRKEGIQKRYLALVHGRWPRHLRDIDAPLQRYERASGERMVRVARDGKPSQTCFAVKQSYAQCTLVEAQPLTGRTHQIRVHAAHAGHSILGDSKYETAHSAELTQNIGLKRLFLHAFSLDFTLDGKAYSLRADLDDELTAVLSQLP